MDPYGPLPVLQLGGDIETPLKSLHAPCREAEGQLKTRQQGAREWIAAWQVDMPTECLIGIAIVKPLLCVTWQRHILYSSASDAVLAWQGHSTCISKNKHGPIQRKRVMEAALAGPVAW